jgi:anthranilate phosphoribosyltransferase
MTIMEITEHPFAEFIKILGKGKKGSRPLTQDEAYRAMKMIMAGEVEQIQLGAFLMLMRVKEETTEELAGFVQAAREFCKPAESSIKVDLDWSSYAGKRRHLPWFILTTLLLAENGIKVFMHGAGGHTEGRIYTEDVLKVLGIQSATSFAEAEQQLQQHNFSYLPLRCFCPQLYDMIELRPLMGLRSPVHTLVRLLNPFDASHTIQGIFHPSYRAVHQQAALLLGQQNMAVLKGEGGETEMWAALFARRHVKAESLEPQQLISHWQGESEDEFATATIIGTAAIALKLLGKAQTQQQAQQLATDYWLNRQKHRFVV